MDGKETSWIKQTPVVLDDVIFNTTVRTNDGKDIVHWSFRTGNIKD